MSLRNGVARRTLITVVVGLVLVLGAGLPADAVAPDTGFSGGWVQVKQPRPNRAAGVATDRRLTFALLSTDSSEGLLLRCYTPAGTPCGRFGGGDGTVTGRDLGYRQAGPIGVTVDHHRRVLVVLGGPTYDSCRVVRLLPDGRLDRHFGRGGTTLVGGSSAMAVTVDGRDRTVVAGSRGMGPTNSDLSVVRLTTGGALDRTFGRRGRATFSVNKTEWFTSVTTDAANRVVAAGITTPFPGTARTRAVVARFTIAGRLDRTFSRNGWLTTGDPGHASSATGVGATRRGVAVGLYTDRSNAAGLAMLTARGSVSRVTVRQCPARCGLTVSTWSRGRLLLTGWVGAGRLALGTLAPSGRLHVAGLRTVPHGATGTSLAPRHDGIVMVAGTSSDDLDESLDFSVVAAARP